MNELPKRIKFELSIKEIKAKIHLENQQQLNLNGFTKIGYFLTWVLFEDVLFPYH